MTGLEQLKKLYGRAKDREHQRQADRRAIMARLPDAMLTDLRALHAAFGTRAAWIELDGETLLGTEPDRSRRVVPVRQHPAAGGKV